MSLVLLFVLFAVDTTTANDCTFSDTSGSTHKLDLTSLKGLNITFREEIVNHVYQYSVCENNFRCEYGDGTEMTGMLNQGNTDQQAGCATVAVFDPEIQPIYMADQKTWIFYYKNGHNCTYNATQPRQPRTLELKYVCNDDLDGPFQIEAMVEPLTCIYELIIETDLACVDTKDDSSGDTVNNLSAGSILLIIFFVFMIMYCSIGCVIGKCQSIPHYKFWCNLHLYVIAGCQETRDIVCKC